MPLTVGEIAPEFELPLEPGEAPLRLSDYRGESPVVLLFFPLAFSPVCTEEFARVKNHYEKWKELGAEVIGISVDSPFVTRRFARECGATFPIVSDFNRTVATAFDVRNDDFFGLEGVANRAAFVLDRDGSVVHAWMSEDPERLPPFDEIRETLQGLAAGGH